MAVCRCIGSCIAIRTQSLRRLHGLLRESDSCPGRADICVARLELETGALADCAIGGAGIVRRCAIWRCAGYGQQEIPPQVPVVQSICDFVDECAVLFVDLVLLGGIDREVGFRRFDRQQIMLGGGSNGFHRHAGALV